MLKSLNFANRFKVVVPYYDAPFFETELNKKGIGFQIQINNKKIIYSIDVEHRKTVETSLKSNGIQHNLDVYPLLVNLEEKKIVGIYIKFVALFAVLMLVLKLVKAYVM